MLVIVVSASPLCAWQIFRLIVTWFMDMTNLNYHISGCVHHVSRRRRGPWTGLSSSMNTIAYGDLSPKTPSMPRLTLCCAFTGSTVSTRLQQYIQFSSARAKQDKSEQSHAGAARCCERMQPWQGHLVSVNSDAGSVEGRI